MDWAGERVDTGEPVMCMGAGSIGGVPQKLVDLGGASA